MGADRVMEAMEGRHEAIELILARFLRIGSLLAAVLIALGIGLGAFGLAPGAASPLMIAGLMVLVATPVLRVVVALVVFLREKDLLFATFCLVVLASLAGGMIMGQTH